MPVRTAIVKKTRNQCERGSGEKGTLLHSWWRRQYGDPSKKLRIEPPHDPAILLLDIYPKNTKTTNSKDMHTALFTAALFTTAKICS